MLGKNITSNEKKKFIISVYDDGYKAKTELLKNIWKVSWVFIIGSILGSILYILSHVYYTVKKRSYETGIFYTMGLNRWTVFKQLVIELLLVSVIAVVAAGILSVNEADRFSGYVQNICIKQTADLETAAMNNMEYIEADKTDPSIFTATDYGSENLTVAIETKAGLKQLGFFSAAAFIVILSGILATVLNVLKYNPIEDFQKSNGGV
jgi:ABC-type antimicrobial peptide transport system permease subunit